MTQFMTQKGAYYPLNCHHITFAIFCNSTKHRGTLHKVGHNLYSIARNRAYLTVYLWKLWFISRPHRLVANSMPPKNPYKVGKFRPISNITCNLLNTATDYRSWCCHHSFLTFALNLVLRRYTKFMDCLCFILSIP